MHGSIYIWPVTTPRETPGQVQPFWPVVGNYFKRARPRGWGGGGGKSKVASL